MRPGRGTVATRLLGYSDQYTVRLGVNEALHLTAVSSCPGKATTVNAQAPRALATGGGGGHSRERRGPRTRSYKCPDQLGVCMKHSQLPRAKSAHPSRRSQGPPGVSPSHDKGDAQRVDNVPMKSCRGVWAFERPSSTSV